MSVLNVFFVDNRSEMERLVGSPVTGFANWSADAIFLVCSPDWRSFEKHEFAHIITMGIWGTPHETSRWMVEGIAIAADGWCREYLEATVKGDRPIDVEKINNPGCG